MAIQRSRMSANVCLELQDHSLRRYAAIDFFQTHNARDPLVQAARLTEQFATQNRALAARLDSQIEHEFDGKNLNIVIRSGSAVGAIPLFSPSTARLDYGLVIQPRFQWSGIGPMLGEMGWKVSPVPLRMPLLRRSERRVPPWVLSLMILARLKALLDSLDRRFETVSEIRTAPRGTIRWGEYATRSLATAHPFSVPCTFPDLRDDRTLKGAIRHALEKQLRSLETQREYGAYVHRLMELCQQLLRKVGSVSLYIPTETTFAAWLRRPMRVENFLDGIQAIEWTVEERGLAGLSDLEGIPWTMPMDQFFEAWVETVFCGVARSTGAQLKTGRRRETPHALNWDPPYLGSQKSLVPDLILEWESATLIVDAKYKRHWEEIQERPWFEVEEQLREQHRNDLLQVLAYASLARTRTVIACLVYPCSANRWQSLRERGRLVHKAMVSVGPRAVHLWLTAVPMAVTSEKTAVPLGDAIRSALGWS
jgi:hypothetical protein